MKRAILISMMLFLAATTFGQFTLGPKVGLTMSKLSTNFEDVKEEAKAGFQFGAFARFGKKLYVQPEVMFATKGGTIKSEGTDIKTDIKLNTLQVPVIVGFHLLNLKVVNVRVHGGPAVSFVMKEEIDINQVIEDPIKEDNIKNTIWNFQLGAGVDVLMFTLDVRYEWGLNNIFDPQDGGQSYDMKNNLWNISLGWKIL